jgi:hypothetical protein
MSLTPELFDREAEPAAVLRMYFHAKDENRPWLLDRVFADNAKLEVINRSSAIAFPAVTVGREAIADVLVRDFGRVHENVYSFYMARPPAGAARFSCDWLVCMSEKDSRSVKVGCGRYDWVFEPQPPGLARELTIAIETMQVLPPSQSAAVNAWIGRLPYPWASAKAAVDLAPPIEALAPVLEYLRLARSWTEG